MKLTFFPVIYDLLSLFETFVDMICGDCENPIKQESIESNDTRLRVCDCVSEERQQATALGRKKKKNEFDIVQLYHGHISHHLKRLRRQDASLLLIGSSVE